MKLESRVWLRSYIKDTVPLRAWHSTCKLVLIRDLFEGGLEDEFMKCAASLVTAGVQFTMLLALSDEDAPHFEEPLAAELATLGMPRSRVRRISLRS